MPAGVISVLHHIHVSEKAARLIDLNQYTFRVAKGASKDLIKKNVEKMYDVKVTAVRVQTMPSKTRTVGRHRGVRSGFRKAIVTLAEGHSIGQAK